MASAMFAGPGYLTVAYLSLPYASASSSFSNNVLSYLSRMIVCIISLVPELIGWAISRYSPSAAFRLGIAMNSPFSPSMTLISWITNSLSKVMETICFHLPLFLHPSYSHICYLHVSILLPFLPSAPVLHPFCRNQKNGPHYVVTFTMYNVRSSQ